VFSLTLTLALQGVRRKKSNGTSPGDRRLLAGGTVLKLRGFARIIRQGDANDLVHCQLSRFVSG